MRIYVILKFATDNSDMHIWERRRVGGVLLAVRCNATLQRVSVLQCLSFVRDAAVSVNDRLIFENRLEEDVTVLPKPLRPFDQS